jgi:hypothetical protein
LPSGQTGVYETPSNPTFVSVHPCTRTSRDADGGKQKSSSPSVGRWFAPLPSVLPAGHTIGWPALSRPNCVARTVAPLQNWKWPISSEKALGQVVDLGLYAVPSVVNAHLQPGRRGS